MREEKKECNPQPKTQEGKKKKKNARTPAQYPMYAQIPTIKTKESDQISKNEKRRKPL